MPQTLPTQRPQSGQTFDDALGAADRRYFANGYRRTAYALPTFTVDPDSPQEVFGVARVDYPEDWSRKRGTVRVAHLSTADALVLAADAAQTSLAMLLGCSDDAIREAWFKELSVRTGARPVTVLDHVPVRCRLTPSSDPAESDLLMKIGTFTVTARVSHPPGDMTRRAASSATTTLPTLYTEGFRESIHRGTILDVDPGVPAVACQAEVEARPAQHGIESGLGTGPTLVDCLVFAGQMVQLLICATEDTNREGFGNLWMRRVTFTTSSRARPASSRARLWIAGTQELSRGDSLLRSLDVRCEGIFGTSVTGKAAYSDQPG